MPLTNQEAAAANKSVREIIRVASRDVSLIQLRLEVAKFAAKVFASTGGELHMLGHILGTDRKNNLSPFGHGSDEQVAVSLLMRVATQLISASADLFADGRTYAAAALLRQLVEIEYLAWAFETGSAEGERWLRSDRNQREKFFTPRKLREAAAGKFRGQDYGHHCEFGGHPVPSSSRLLQDDPEIAQLLLSDLLGHTGRIWDHIVRWAHKKQLDDFVSVRNEEMLAKFNAWKAIDPLAKIPPPP